MNFNRAEHNNPATTPCFVDLDLAKAAVLASLRSTGSRRCYEHAMVEFIDSYCSEPRMGFNKGVVTRYRMRLEARGLAAGTINVRLAAIRRLAYEAVDSGVLSPEQAAGIRRVKGAKKLGVRVGNWLLVTQACALWQLPDKKTKGKRDRAILSPGVWFLIQLFNVGSVATAQTGGVAYVAHVAGAVFGALTARVFQDPRRVGARL